LRERNKFASSPRRSEAIRPVLGKFGLRDVDSRSRSANVGEKLRRLLEEERQRVGVLTCMVVGV